MLRSFRVGLAMLAFALMVSACRTETAEETATTVQTTPTPTTTTPVSGIPPGVEPNPDPTPIPTDPDVRIGKLDNGLTYYVRSNDSPGSHLALWLVVNAGSTQQPVADSGHAHFLEHMLFNGTDKFPGNELDQVLRGFGMEIGPDFNAYTSYDETVYMLSVPLARSSGASLDLGFDVLREWAGNALLDPQAVIAERGVVREELRVRTESAAGEIQSHFEEVYNQASGYEGFDPIGTEKAILATTASELRRFYDDWYRPDLMAVVAVGDVPVDRLEQEIVARFMDLRARGGSPERKEIEAPMIDQPLVEVFSQPDGDEPAVSLDYSLPRWDASTVGGEQMLVKETAIALMLQNRLNEAASRGEADIVRPSVSIFPHTRGRLFLGMNIAAENLAQGAEQTLTVLRSMLIDGFTQADLDSARVSLQAGLDQLHDASGGRQDIDFAASYATHFLTGLGISSLDDEYARQTKAVEGLVPADLTGHFRWVMEQSAPLLIVYGADDALLPSQSELEKAVARAGMAGALVRTDITEISQLMTAPDPVAALDSGRIPGVREGRWWRFANGAVVAFQPSDIAPDEIDIWTRGSGGHSLIDEDLVPLVSTAVSAVDASGVGEFDDLTIRHFLDDRVVVLQSYIDETGEGFFGRADSEDSEIIFQLLHLRMTAPRVDPAGMAEAIEATRADIRSQTADPSAQSYVASTKARYGDGPRFTDLPTGAQLDSFTGLNALAIYQTRLATVDDMVVAIVGDADEEEILALAERYIGTLPAGSSDSFANHTPDPPIGPIQLSVGAGTADSGAGFDLLYFREASATLPERAAGEVLGSIIEARLFNQVRERMGASYGGGTAFLSFIEEPAPEIQLGILVDGDPSRLSEIRAAVQEEIDELVTNGPSQEEFAQARSIALSDAEFLNNDTLLTRLQDGMRDWLADPNRQVEDDRDWYFALDEVTPEQITALAKKMLVDRQLIEVTRAPKN